MILAQWSKGGEGGSSLAGLEAKHILVFIFQTTNESYLYRGKVGELYRK